MPATSEPLDYQPPAPRSRWRRRVRVTLIVGLSLAVGIAGKLCWDRFATPIADHFRVLSAQASVDSPNRPTFTLTRVGDDDAVVTISQPPSVHPDDAARRQTITQSVDRFETLLGQARLGDLLWHGRLSDSAGGERIVIVRLHGGMGSSRLRRWLLVQVYTPASLLTAAQVRGSVQFFALTTPNTSASWGPVSVDPNDPAVLIVPEIIDGRPHEARFRLNSLDHLNRQQ